MSKTIDPIPARAAAYVAIYPRLQQIAKDHGYALCVHGSLHRDMDLVAIPWTDDCSDAFTLLMALHKDTGAVVWSIHEEEPKTLEDFHPTKKPHGRIATSLHVTQYGMYGGYFDISVMPKTPVQ